MTLADPTAGTDSLRSARPPLEIVCSPHFLTWLAETGVSLALTTYQTHRLFLLGLKPDGRLSAFERLFDHPMGLAVSPDGLALATRLQIWRFSNCLPAGVSHQGYDQLLVPRHSQVTGALDVHDLAIGKDGSLVFVNTLYSCLATPDDRLSFRPVWKPPFISRLTPEDRCHLNGLAMRDGAPAFVTSVSRSDVAAGWRNRRRDGGSVIEVAGGGLVATGLSMPHSPRWHRDRLWLLNSGAGEFGFVDLAAGAFQPLAFCPGYLRGLALYRNFAVVGLSRPRHDGVFGGLPLQEELLRRDAEPVCGLRVIDIDSGNILHWLDFRGVVSELYDLQLLPGVRRPMALGFKTDEIDRLISFEDEGRQVFHEIGSGAGSGGAG